MTRAKTILVVDDDPLLRAGLQTMLHQHGFETLEAEDGHDARDIIAERAPDLVILDMMMPRWGGFAVLEHFQHQPEAPPFIMITAHEGEKHRAYALRVGAADYLRKPFAFDNLLARVEGLLRAPGADAPPATAPGGTPASLRVCCPACGARIKAPVQLRWQKRPCPNCHRTLVVKPEPPADADPRLVADA